MRAWWLVVMLAVGAVKPAAAKSPTRKPTRAAISWFSAPRHLVFALPVASTRVGATPSLRPHDEPTPDFIGASFTALDFFGRPVGTALGGQFESTPSGSWSPWGFRRVSGSMGAALFVPTARVSELAPEVAEAVTQDDAERRALEAALSTAETHEASTGTGCVCAHSAIEAARVYRGRAPKRAGVQKAFDIDARLAVAGGACLRVMSLEGGAWQSRGWFSPKAESFGDKARLAAILDMDGDGVPELVTEVTDSRQPDAEPTTVVLRATKAGAFRVGAYFVDSGP